MSKEPSHRHCLLLFSTLPAWLGIAVGFSAPLFIASCQPTKEETIDVPRGVTECALMIDPAAAADFSDILESAGVLCRDAPVRLRHPELPGEIEFPKAASSLEMIWVTVRTNEVVWDDEIVSLAQLEAKASGLVEQVRPTKTEPMVGLSSNSDVPLARGIVVLKVLADAGITRIVVSDPQSGWIERERARPAPPYSTRPLAPRRIGR